jgi:hypothetical protein
MRQIQETMATKKNCQARLQAAKERGAPGWIPKRRTGLPCLPLFRLDTARITGLVYCVATPSCGWAGGRAGGRACVRAIECVRECVRACDLTQPATARHPSFAARGWRALTAATLDIAISGAGGGGERATAGVDEVCPHAAELCMRFLGSLISPNAPEA